MKSVEVDAEICEGFGVCASLAPHIFREGATLAIRIDAESIGDADEETLDAAVELCPRGALR
ncbi:ferredoxin [Nocardia salmonicida]|uniref:ferredoxin n=1 Tax=Nocardia salmonicida TaxID=53431 RepID=UPI003407FEBA